MSDLSGERFCGIFERRVQSGLAQIAPREAPRPSSVIDPHTGRALRISTIQAGTPAICPSCLAHGSGGFVSFEDDMRIAYACPSCERLVWLAGC